MQTTIATRGNDERNNERICGQHKIQCKKRRAEGGCEVTRDCCVCSSLFIPAEADQNNVTYHLAASASSQPRLTGVHQSMPSTLET